MKLRTLMVTSALALLLGLTMAATVTQKAAAACYDASKNEVPCDSTKKKVVPPTPIPPTATLAPTATLTPVPSPTPTTDAGAAPVAAIIPPAAPSAQAAACGTSPIGGLLAGLGLLAAGVILRLAPRARGTGPDAFAYPASQGQGGEIGTAFGQGATGANGRLNNAQGLIRTMRLAALPALGIGGLLALGAGAGYAGLLGCQALPASGPLSSSGFGLAVALPALAVAIILWGIFEINVKYTLFLPDGTPDRATVHIAMKQAGGEHDKKESGSSGTDDPFRKQ